MLSLVPDVILGSTLYTRTVPWLGVTYADPPPTTFGVFAFAYHLGVLVLLFGRYLARFRSVEFRAPCIAIVQEEAERLRDIVSDLLQFARPRPPIFAPAALDEIVRSAVDAACEGIGATPADVVVELGPVPVSRCDERLVRQAIVNLVTNALQAPERTGPVRVALSRRDAQVAIAVSDDGAGVPAEDRERVFTPFYSTRPTGTGLGLAIVRSAADAHDGTVTLTDTPGGGATFTLRFPGQRPA